MKHERFKSGNITTAFIEEGYPDGFEGVTPNGTELKALAGFSAAMKLVDEERITKTSNSGTEYDWRDYVVTIAGTRQDIAIRRQAEKQDCFFEIAFGLEDDAPTHSIFCDYHPMEQLVTGSSADFVCATELAELMPEKVAPDTSKLLLCPMPGLVVKLHVAEGESVEEGQPLAMIEAMKMENVLRAEKAGVVAKVPVSEGDSLAVDEIIMEFEG
ncbi:Propionyl-CoA carboxylase alpha chain, mitochondrial [Nymphon striatum]|nr:Propionyl-CoA carboxylase alpha chain, mitochondrial [Nymphon striatum]